MLKEKNGAGGAAGRNALVSGRSRLCLQPPVVRGVRILKGRKRGAACVFGQETLVYVSASSEHFGAGSGGARACSGWHQRLTCWAGARTDRRLWVLVGAVTPGRWARLSSKHRTHLGCRNGEKKVVPAWQPLPPGVVCGVAALRSLCWG